MRLDTAIELGQQVLKGAQGPKNQRTYQKLPPPENPVAAHLPNPVPIDVGAFGLPQRVTPAVSVGIDSLRQFNKPSSLPQRRTIGPNPL